jgi:hypothetical protein
MECVKEPLELSVVEELPVSLLLGQEVREEVEECVSVTLGEPVTD